MTVTRARPLPVAPARPIQRQGFAALAALLVLSTGLAGCLDDQGAGDRAPDFTLTTLDGRTVTLDDYQGQVLVIDVMATWCAPCKEAMPEIRRFHEEHADDPVSVLSVSVERESDGDPLPAFKEEFNATWDFAYDTDTVFQRYRVHGIPTVIVLDADGVLRERHQVAKLTYDDLERMVTPLMEEARAHG